MTDTSYTRVIRELSKDGEYRDFTQLMADVEPTGEGEPAGGPSLRQSGCGEEARPGAQGGRRARTAGPPAAPSRTTTATAGPAAT
jgi:hypothetical protein